jgi:hypothetical protein
MIFCVVRWRQQEKILTLHRSRADGLGVDARSVREACRRGQGWREAFLDFPVDVATLCERVVVAAGRLYFGGAR